MDHAYAEKGDTWPKVLKYNYQKHGRRRKAMRYKEHGIWRPYTWEDYYLDTKYLALGLLALGFEPGNKVLIIGENAPQWYAAELSAQANHGISVGAYSDLSPSEVKYIAQNSEATFAIVEDQEQVDKLREIKGGLPLLKKVIYWNYKGLAHYDDPLLMGYRQVVQLGRQYDKENAGVFERNVESGNADDICAIVYTAGTTERHPKGAMHTYATMRAGSNFYLRLEPWHERDDVVPFLPPAWMSEQWFLVGCHLLSASVLNFAEGTETLRRDATEVGPTVVFQGSRLWESQAAMVQARILDVEGLKKIVFGLLMPVGYRMADLRFGRKKPNMIAKTLYALADLILFRGIRASLGLSRARICYSTGSVLSPDAFRFYHALNLPVKSVYATTEGGALTGAGNDDISPETVGTPFDGTEVRISDAGELSYRQPGTFVGYYKDPEKTLEALSDGWFHSGDAVVARQDGHIVFVDRMASRIQLSSGDTMAPQLTESRLRFSPYIRDAWVLAGVARPYPSAVIVIDYVNVGKWAGKRRIAFNNFAELSQNRDVYELITHEIGRVNGNLPAGLRVRKFINLHKEFDPDAGEMTRTRNLRRTVLEEHYRGLADAIYGGEEGFSMEVHVGHGDGQRGTRMTTIDIKSVEGAAS